MTALMISLFAVHFWLLVVFMASRSHRRTRDGDCVGSHDIDGTSGRSEVRNHDGGEVSGDGGGGD